MSDPAPPPASATRPGTARGRGRIIVDLSDHRRPRHTPRGPASSAGRCGARFRACTTRAGSRRSSCSASCSRCPVGHHRPGRGRRGRCPGVLGGRPDLAQRRRPVPPDRPVPAVRLRARGCCPCFAPWAVLPWDVAWFVWRVGTILLLLWTIHWAYRRRPLTTAVIVRVLAFPFGANLDTGNINLQLTLMLWAAQFTGPRLGGLLWALATWMKWVPALLAHPARPGEALGPRLAGRLDRAEPRDAAAHDPPVPGTVRVRGAADPPRLPRLRLVLGAVALPPARSVRLPAAGDVAAWSEEVPATLRRRITRPAAN